eukprot:CAMPEP_0174915334 /NCGR_PEP_ID=MMETSP1355-20121228/907_1 /TAXON_ID=464990 /ORGANISM="Hemiselmis tepida, Strain CCMP443" /LENGTH=282 /DNA_ID=CAMNT_0016160207 /DNA_START=130 /DNA_END=978 /DNA_ORIENTATION=-
MTTTTSTRLRGPRAAAAVGILIAIAALAVPTDGQVVAFRAGHQRQPSMYMLDTLARLDHLFESAAAGEAGLIAASSYGEGGGKAVYSEVLGVGCTPVQTLHKEIENVPSQSTVKLFVSRTCGAGHAALSNISASTDAEGELAIAATPEGGVEFRQTLALPRNADPSTISAIYDSTLRVLTVTVKIAEPTPVDISIKTVADAPEAPPPDALPSSAEPAAQPAAKQADGSAQQGARKGENWRKAARAAKEEVRREQAVEDQIKKLEEELARMKAAGPGAESVTQ